jgi:hypothetical protein
VLDISWQPAITLAGGPGCQTAKSVMIRDGEMLIGGFDGQQAIIWRLPAWQSSSARRLREEAVRQRDRDESCLEASDDRLLV